jgi:hypothetical protein
MALSEMDNRKDYGCTEAPRQPEVYRVIDDGFCILTTLDSTKALKALLKLIDKHDISACWADVEILK